MAEPTLEEYVIYITEYTEQLHSIKSFEFFIFGIGLITGASYY